MNENEKKMNRKDPNKKYLNYDWSLKTQYFLD